MRVLRIAVGIVTLLLAIPVLLTGGLAWWVMQHRSPDGAFQAHLAPINVAGPAGTASSGEPAGSSSWPVVVVPDVDALLRRDAPFARADQTVLRLTADDAFFGLARPADVAQYLAGVGYTEIQQARPARGALPVLTTQHSGTAAALPTPQQQDFWVQQGLGELSWEPASQRGRQLALVVIPAADQLDSLAAPPGAPSTVQLTASVTAGWLSSTTWGLLSLGPVLLLLGFVILAWPQRSREVVYVMGDGYQVATFRYRPAVTPYPSHVAAVAPAPPPPPPPPPHQQQPPVPAPAPAPRVEADPGAAADSSSWPEEDDRPMPIAGLRFTR